MTNDKPESPERPSGSASDSQPLDRSLERVFGASERATRGHTRAVDLLREDVAKLRTDVAAVYAAMSEMRSWSAGQQDQAMRLIGRMVVETATLSELVRTNTTAQSIAVGATINAREALVAAGRRLQETGEHLLIRPEDEEGAAPRGVRVLVVRLTNYAWPYAVRLGVVSVVAIGAWASALWSLIRLWALK